MMNESIKKKCILLIFNEGIDNELKNKLHEVYNSNQNDLIGYSISTCDCEILLQFDKLKYFHNGVYSISEYFDYDFTTYNIPSISNGYNKLPWSFFRKAECMEHMIVVGENLNNIYKIILENNSKLANKNKILFDRKLHRDGILKGKCTISEVNAANVLLDRENECAELNKNIRPDLIGDFTYYFFKRSLNPFNNIEEIIDDSQSPKKVTIKGYPNNGNVRLKHYWIHSSNSSYGKSFFLEEFRSKYNAYMLTDKKNVIGIPDTAQFLLLDEKKNVPDFETFKMLTAGRCNVALNKKCAGKSFHPRFDVQLIICSNISPYETFGTYDNYAKRRYMSLESMTTLESRVEYICLDGDEKTIRRSFTYPKDWTNDQFKDELDNLAAKYLIPNTKNLQNQLSFLKSVKKIYMIKNAVPNLYDLIHSDLNRYGSKIVDLACEIFNMNFKENEQLIQTMLYDENIRQKNEYIFKCRDMKEMRTYEDLRNYFNTGKSITWSQFIKMCDITSHDKIEEKIDTYLKKYQLIGDSKRFILNLKLYIDNSQPLPLLSPSPSSSSSSLSLPSPNSRKRKIIDVDDDNNSKEEEEEEKEYNKIRAKYLLNKKNANKDPNYPRNYKTKEYIGRRSQWGNIFTVEEYGRDLAIQKYKEHIESNPILLSQLYLLKGKKLECFCYPEKCHGDILLKLLIDKYGISEYQ